MPETPKAGAAVESAAEHPEPAEHRIVACVDSLLELVGLLFGQAALRDCFVDAVLERLLQRVGELRRFDAELLGRIVDDRLALLARLEHP